MTRRKPANGASFLTAILDPKVTVPLIVALGSAFGYTAVESVEKRDGGFKEGFLMCREMAQENRDAGFKKIIPKFREELLEQEELEVKP